MRRTALGSAQLPTQLEPKWGFLSSHPARATLSVGRSPSDLWEPPNKAMQLTSGLRSLAADCHGVRHMLQREEHSYGDGNHGGSTAIPSMHAPVGPAVVRRLPWPPDSLSIHN